jgi:hypothetical protein
MDYKKERVIRVLKENGMPENIDQIYALVLDAVHEERERCAQFCDNAEFLYEKVPAVRRCARMIGKAIREKQG